MYICCVFVGLDNKRLWSFRVPKMSVITWPPARLAAPQQELLREVGRKFWQGQVMLLLSTAINLDASMCRKQVNTSIRQQDMKVKPSNSRLFCTLCWYAKHSTGVSRILILWELKFFQIVHESVGSSQRTKSFYQILYCPTNALNYINCRVIKNTLKM